MGTAFIIFIIIAVLAAVVALIAFGIGYSATQRVRDLDTAAPVTASSLSSASGRVQVSGTAIPGPGGPISAPLSETPCVWWHATIERRWADQDAMSAGERDGAGTPMDRSDRDEQYSEQPFGIRTSDGPIPVAGGVVDHDLPATLSDTQHGEAQIGPSLNLGPVSIGAGGADVEVHRRETALPVDTPLLVIGDAIQRPDGSMAIGGHLRLSTASAEETRSSSERTARTGRLIAGVAVVAAVAAVLTRLL